MRNQCFNYFALTCMRGEHERSLAVAVPGVHISALGQKGAYLAHVTAGDGFFPSGVHYPSTFHSNLVASAISNTANNLRSNSTFMRCAALAPSGAVSTLARAIQNMAGR